MEVSNALHDWAVKEMQFTPSGRYLGLPSPTPEDFSRLCRGQMVDIWTYMMKHVRSSSTVYTIRQNLKLQDIRNIATGTSTRKKEPKLEEIEDLKSERTQSQKKLNAVLAKLEQAEKEFQQTEKKLLNADTAFRAEKSKLDATTKKTSLLRLYTQVAADKNGTLQQYAKYLQSMGASFSTQRLNSSTLQWTLEERSENLCQLHLENVCCNYSSLFFESMISERNENVLAQNHKKLIDMTGKLSATFSPVELFTALNKIAKSAVDEISSATARSNREQELEALKFQYSSGELIDLSSPPEISQSVARVLEEVRANHAKMFISALKAQNSALKTDKLVEEAKEDLCLQLQSETCDRDTTEQLQRNLELQLEITSCVAALECLQKRGKELCSALEEKSNLARKLEMQTEQIKNFEQNKMIMLQSIQKCINLNVNVHGQLNQLKLQITNYIKDNLLGREQDLVSAIEPLWNHMEEELDLVKLVPIHSLQTVRMENGTVVPVQSLSIYNPMVPVGNSSDQPRLSQIYSILDFPAYQSPEALLLFVLKKKLEKSWLKTFYNEIRDTDKIIFCRAGDKNCSIAGLEGLSESVVKSDQIQLETTLPSVKATLANIQSGLELCVDIRNQMNEWWEQPAQHIPCSITVSGHTFQEWKRLWMKNYDKQSSTSQVST